MYIIYQSIYWSVKFVKPKKRAKSVAFHFVKDFGTILNPTFVAS